MYLGPKGPGYGGCMIVGVYIDIAYMHICIYISCQQLGGCISIGVYIGIVYIKPTIGGICVICWVSFGPSGPG